MLRQRGATPVVKAGDLKIDIARRKVMRGENDIRLTPKEFDLPKRLIQNAGQNARKMVTRRQLLQAVRQPAHLEDTYLRDDGFNTASANAAGRIANR
jgi:two-component system KDP operon response regulator KdpE